MVQIPQDWALFRLTDAGLEIYKAGGDLAIDMVGMSIDDAPATVEVSRHGSEQAARTAWNKLPKEERDRTLAKQVARDNKC